MAASNPIDFIRVPSKQMKGMIERYQAALPPEVFENLIADIRKNYETYMNRLGNYHPGVDRALMGHRMLNIAIQNTSQVNPTCNKGCSACCHLEVQVTNDEGALLAQIVKEGFAIDQKRLKSQAEREPNSLDWHNLVTESNRCVFLGDDQACQVYDFRPSICRKHLVTSEPAQCTIPGGAILPIQIPLAEIALSAILSQPGNSYTTLSKSLMSFLFEKPQAQDTSTPEDLPTTPEITIIENQADLIPKH